jgi:uncharacterized protein (TIGR03067 family)
MRSAVSRLVVLAGALLLAGADSSREFDGATQLDEIQGSWREVPAERNGKPVRGKSKIVVTFDGVNVTYRFDKQIANKGTYRVDSSRRPGRLDEIFVDGLNRGSSFKNIYRIDGNKLRIAYTDDGSSYPESFETAPFVDTYERVR